MERKAKKSKKESAKKIEKSLIKQLQLGFNIKDK